METPKLNKKAIRRKCIPCNTWFHPLRNNQWVCSPKCAMVKNNEKWNKKKETLKSKEWKKDKAKLKIDTHSKEHRKALQNEINKLARMIDAKCGYLCIDCGKEYGKQVDGAHFHSRGANCSLRYNLHNIHSAKSDCNQYSDTHKSGYAVGLIKRYGQEYMDMMMNLPVTYKEVKLSNLEVYEKLKLVRKIIRNFGSADFSHAFLAREFYNKVIGIYNNTLTNLCFVITVVK